MLEYKYGEKVELLIRESGIEKTKKDILLTSGKVTFKELLDVLALCDGESRIIKDMSTYSYKNPKFINSPKGVVEVVEVIYDGKDDPAYSLAIIKWENTYKLGIRWNIAYSEWDDYRKQNGQDECIGNPQSRGIPTWFVLPDDMMFSEKFSGAMQRLDELRKGK